MYFPPQNGEYPLGMTEVCGEARDPRRHSMAYSGRGSPLASVLSSLFSCIYYYLCIACLISCFRRRARASELGGNDDGMQTGRSV